MKIQYTISIRFVLKRVIYLIILSDTNGVCCNSVEEEKYFKFFTLEKIEDLKRISEGNDILMEVFKSLEKLNNDSIFMSLLEEKELDEYC